MLWRSGCGVADAARRFGCLRLGIALFDLCGGRREWRRRGGGGSLLRRGCLLALFAARAFGLPFVGTLEDEGLRLDIRRKSLREDACRVGAREQELHLLIRRAAGHAAGASARALPGGHLALGLGQSHKMLPHEAHKCVHELVHPRHARIPATATKTRVGRCEHTSGRRLVERWWRAWGVRGGFGECVVVMGSAWW